MALIAFSLPNLPDGSCLGRKTQGLLRPSAASQCSHPAVVCSRFLNRHAFGAIELRPDRANDLLRSILFPYLRVAVGSAS